jgi:4-diphosphocytidyl-2-C-methyl-D-erythritol kinase
VKTPLVLQAPAKINLTLEILAKRADGYHEVRMLMAGVSLADELSFEAAPGLSLSCDLPGLDCSEKNLVLRAARALQKVLGREAGAKIHLTKRIPLGGGLAGGSTDAAATLKGLNQLWEGGLDRDALRRIAAELGSDVPFCLEGGWAYATGRGEQLETLPAPDDLHLVLANPGFEVSTQWAYSKVGTLSLSKRNVSREAFQAIQTKNIPALDLATINDLEKVTSAHYPDIVRLEQTFLAEGALISRMSGSGPTVWGLFKDADASEKACEIIKKMDIRAVAVHTMGGRS